MSSPSLAGAARTPQNDRIPFPAAYEALRPFFDPHTQWGSGGAQGVLAYRTLKDHFPELSPQESFLIVATARRVFRGSPDAS